MDRRIDGQIDGRMGRTDGRTIGRTDGRSVGRTDGRTVGRTDGQTDGRTDNQLEGYKHTLLSVQQFVMGCESCVAPSVGAILPLSVLGRCWASICKRMAQPQLQADVPSQWVGTCSNCCIAGTLELTIESDSRSATKKQFAVSP